MYVTLSCAIVDADPTNRQELVSFLARFGVQCMSQLGTPEALQPLLSRSDAPQLVIINLDPAAHENLKKIAQLPRTFPNVNFFVMSQVLDAHLLMEAMHMGIKEFIPLPVSEEKFAQAIDRVAQVSGAGRTARIINVIPTIGGCGSTTVACNVAAALALVILVASMLTSIFYLRALREKGQGSTR